MKLQAIFILFLVVLITSKSLCMNLFTEEQSRAWDPNERHKNSVSELEAGMKFLEDEKIPLNAVVVVFGCKTGCLAAYIAKNIVPHGKVIGFDLNRNMVDFAKNNYDAISNLEFKHNFFGILAEQSVDFVISMNCLSWIKNRENIKLILSEVARYLKQDGWLIMRVAIRDSDSNPTPLYKAITEVAEGKYAKFYGEHVSFLNELGSGDYVDLMLECGLQATVFIEKSPLSMCSWDMIKEGLSTLPTVRLIPAELRQMFFDDLFSAICKYVHKGSQKSFLIQGTFCKIKAQV